MVHGASFAIGSPDVFVVMVRHGSLGSLGLPCDQTRSCFLSPMSDPGGSISCMVEVTLGVRSANGIRCTVDWRDGANDDMMS